MSLGDLTVNVLRLDKLIDLKRALARPTNFIIWDGNAIRLTKDITRLLFKG
jgi:hypothetical protein